MAKFPHDPSSQSPHLDITDTPAPPRNAPLEDPTKAVALAYDKTTDTAPRIVATGKGAIAEQILNLAFANGVKVRKDADLMEILEHLEVDSVIPLEAFAAVAEILAYVYKANALYGKSKG